jgi:Arc/MetJ-type ribon-helix-helix transcriptional regulator
MGIIQVRLPEEVQEIIDRQVAAGRVASADAYLVEAVRRFAEDLAVEEGIVAQAEAGIVDSFHYGIITISEDAEALHEWTVSRVPEDAVEGEYDHCA